MDDSTYPREPQPAEYRALVCLRVAERLLSAVLVGVLLWRTLCGPA